MTGDPAGEGTGRGGPSRRRRHRWRAALASAVTAGVLVAVFAGIFPRFAHYSQAWSAIRRMPAPFVAALAAAAAANVAIGAWPMQAALPRLRYFPAFVVDQSSFAVSNALPGGSALSLGVEYGMLESYGFGPGKAASASAISTVFNVLATLVMPAVGVLALLLTGEATWHYVSIAVAVALVAGAALAGIAVVLHSERGARAVGGALDRLLNRVAGRLIRRRGVRVAARILDFRSTVVDVMRHRWPAVIGSSVLPLLASWAILLVALQGLERGSHTDFRVSWAESLAAYSFSVIVAFIPVSTGGLGTVDATLIGLLAVFGATASQALAVDITWRAATFVPQVLIGALAFAWWRLTAARGRRPADPRRAR
ncbi:lysylphosphatidylglycerol synthase transmembrane domain-containing protein [Rhizomonospora bruguierae]|uniref:lysylphosphatidylglycerol synthase transmembrane domain-containing protein n=1 Tax=Rhizomonospora bruguierae TaxID=1581705 RepID=UPI001BD1967A|nr:YbhN family protein [Micromonospora sp. NBRC 107566]